MEPSGQDLETSATATSSITEIISYKTVVKSARSLVNWDIENFSLICPNPSLTKFSGKDKGEFFSLFAGTKSPIYKTILPGSITDQKQIELEWHFDLEFTAADHDRTTEPGDRDNYMTFGLHFEDYKDAESLGLIFSISIIGRDSAVVFKKGPIATTLSKFNPKRILMWPKFLLVKRLWDNEHTYLVNDVLHLRVDLTISRKPLSRQSNTPTASYPSWATSDLIEDLGQLLKSQKGADITIHCGEKTFMVHSSILIARSPVFERMFDADMMESVNKSVTIEDVDPLDLEAFFVYLYTSKISFPMDNLPRLIGLVQVADKYQMIKLKSFCFDLILKLTSLENAGEIAVLAYIMSAENEVRDMVSKFCLENWSALTQDMSFRKCVEQNPSAFLTTLTVKKPRLGLDEVLQK